MRVIAKFLRTIAADKSGATAIEYGLICSLIVIVILGSVQAVAGGTTAMFDLIVSVM
jgi:pilus assembly protein Flp/PilA